MILASRDETLAIAIDANRIELLRLGSRFPMEKARDDLLEVLRQGSKREPEFSLERIQEAGQNLRDLVFPTVLETWILSLSALTIIDVDSLGALPYAVIPFDQSSFGESVAFSQASSLTGEFALSKRAGELTDSAHDSILFRVRPLACSRTSRPWSRP